MRRIQLPDLWHLEKALTAVAMIATVLLIITCFVTIGDRFGFVAGSVFAAAALSACIWIIIKFVPLSDYRAKKP
ncbi:hypothetical protein D3C71_480980 [compost metagenome]